MLKNRFHRPTITPNIIFRERLVDLINQNSDKSLVLVSAPAGYGKSMAISQWLKSQNRAYSWLSIDTRFNNFTIFIEYFTQALIHLEPSCKEEFKDIVQESALIDAEAIAEKICNSCTGKKQGGILVLDDLHLIINPSIHHLINYLIYNLPQLRLVILSRFDPPLKLKRARLYGYLLEIRVADLMVDSREFQLLLDLQKTKFKANNSALLERSEGWILGILMLLKLNTMEKEGLDESKVASLMVDMDFLIEEFMPQLPKNFLEPLMLAAECERFNRELLEELFQKLLKQKVDVEAFIFKLKEYNLFLIGLDSSNEWYRFHHLFSEVLRNKTPEKVYNRQKALLILSNWFANKGLIQEAIGYQIRDKNYHAAASLIVAHRRNAFNKGQWWIVKSWLDQLPETYIKSNPSLLLAMIWVLEIYWNHSEIDHYLLLLKRSIEKIEMTDLEKSEYYFHLSFRELFHNSNTEKALEYAQKSKALYKDGKNLGARRELIIAFSKQMRGRMNEAIQNLNTIEEEYSSNDIFYLRSFFTKIMILLLSGQFKKARETSQHFLFISKNTYRSAEAWSIYLAANIAFQYFRTPNIATYRQNIVAFEGSMDWRALMDIYAGQCLYYILSKDIDSAQATLKIMQLKMKQSRRRDRKQVYHSTEMRMLWLSGDKKKTLAWAKDKLEIDIKAVDPLCTIEVPLLTRIRILITFGNTDLLDRGIVLLNSLEEMMLKVHNTYHQIDIFLLKSLAHYRRKEYNSMHVYLEKAFKVYAIQKIKRPFVEFMMATPYLFKGVKNIPFSLLPVLQEQIKLAPETIFPLRGREKESNQLTHREIQIAKLTALGLRNKEIADQLNISLATVKSHLTHIYQKLRVQNRTSMIKKMDNLS